MKGMAAEPAIKTGNELFESEPTLSTWYFLPPEFQEKIWFWKEVAQTGDKMKKVMTALESGKPWRTEISCGLF